jgi:hypothetical protein
VPIRWHCFGAFCAIVVHLCIVLVHAATCCDMLRHVAICAAMLLAIGNAAMHASYYFICCHIRQGDIPVDKL